MKPLRLGVIFPLILAAVSAASGCTATEKKMEVEVVVFNYNPQPIAEITIQGQYIGGFYGGYGPGGTGGKIYCCVNVKPGSAEVKWRYSGVEGGPKVGVNDKAIGVIPEPESTEHKYLGVHLYQNSAVEFTLTRDIPGEKKQGRPHE